MEETKSVPVALTETRSVDAYKHDPDQVVVARLTEEEIFRMSGGIQLEIKGYSSYCGNHVCSRLQPYGVDWGVISGIVGT
jgi:hypothetical protein